MKSIIVLQILLLVFVTNSMSQDVNNTIYVQENSMVTYTRSYSTNALLIPQWQVYSNTKLGYIFLKHHSSFVFNSITYKKLILNNESYSFTQNQIGMGYRFIYPASKITFCADVFASKINIQNCFKSDASTLVTSGPNSNGFAFGGEIGFFYFASSNIAIDFSVNYFLEKLTIDYSGYEATEKKKGLRFSLGLLYFILLEKDNKK